MAESRVVVITGVSRGLGRSMAAGFVRRGHTVVGCSRSEGAIAKMVETFGEPHRFDVVDVADHAAVAAWAKEVLGAHGPPDLLVNNAALVNELATLWEVPPEDFSRIVDVNIKGVFHVIRGFVPAMVERGSGVIVNFSSGWGRSVSPEVGPYCTTKWAIEGMTRALADELPRGMAAVPLNPGIINTEMLQTAFGTGAAAYPSPDAWAEKAVPFLLGLGPNDNGEPLTVPT
jgi:NAD(P)-dependent dehydrogenase (short-subunit alcohol dehydrogenase family)